MLAASISLMLNTPLLPLPRLIPALIALVCVATGSAAWAAPGDAAPGFVPTGFGQLILDPNGDGLSCDPAYVVAGACDLSVGGYDDDVAKAELKMIPIPLFAAPEPAAVVIQIIVNGCKEQNPGRRRKQWHRLSSE